MAKRMLIDAAHPEETRVVVLNGDPPRRIRLRIVHQTQVKGNIYLAKVTRVEPSLQAAFVDYGGNRHGFLAFSEIHPDYYRIPVGDRMHDRPIPGRQRADRDAITNDEAGSEDAGVPLAAALPEPVRVPQGEAEDDFSADEANGDPRSWNSDPRRMPAPAGHPPARCDPPGRDHRDDPRDETDPGGRRSGTPRRTGTAPRERRGGDEARRGRQYRANGTRAAPPEPAAAPSCARRAGPRPANAEPT